MSTKPTREAWIGNVPCVQCGDPSEPGEDYCRGCLRDRREAAKHAASHEEKGAA